MGQERENKTKEGSKITEKEITQRVSQTTGSF